MLALLNSKLSTFVKLAITNQWLKQRKMKQNQQKIIENRSPNFGIKKFQERSQINLSILKKTHSKETIELKRYGFNSKNHPFELSLIKKKDKNQSDPQFYLLNSFQSTFFEKKIIQFHCQICQRLYFNRLIRQMLSEIPRTPIFPEHSKNPNNQVINKEMKRIQKDVEDDVIPVSAGIYSEYKLVERLQAIPKPDIVNYEDRIFWMDSAIFFETINTALFPCKSNNCPLCGQEYGNKKNVATQCCFCGIWNCSSCICPRKRYHPRAKEISSQRFSICYTCDDKFLSLTLNHVDKKITQGFVENRALLEEVMKRARKQKDEYQKQCDKRQEDSNYSKDIVNKNKFKISSFKKEQNDLKKTIAKLQSQRQEDTMKLRVREKYLSILLKKKESIKQKQEQKQYQQSTVPTQQQMSPKVIRSLSQNNVYSQSIRLESSSKNEDNSIKETNYSQAEETVYSPPNEKIDEPLKQEKTNNFFNYDSWGREEKSTKRDDQINQRESQEQIIHTEKQDMQEDRIFVQKTQTAVQKKIAQIFSKPEKAPQKDDYSSEDENQSLDDEVIKFRKAALMKAAIEQSHKSRIESMEQSFPQSEPKKCSCQIY